MKVSIITATYNSAATIVDTLQSVLRQTHQDIDYWIIDGGSKDNTIKLVKQYEAQFNGRLHWISEPDKGIYDAMNKGISRSTGDIVGILNSDDFFTSDDVVEKVAAAFEQDGVDSVFGDIHFVDNKDLNTCVRYYSSASFRPWKLRFGYMPAHPSFYARREVFETNGLYSLQYKICSDYDMMVRLFYKAKISYRYLNIDMVTMRTGGISTANIKNRILISKEDVKACRTYGMKTCLPLVCVKYLTKVFEFKIL